MFKSLQASSNINFSWSPTLWKFGSCLDIQIERWSNWDTEPELPCEVLMRIHLLHSSFTSNICESSKSSQEYLAFLSYQNYQQSCFVTNQSKSVSPLDGLRDIERPSLPSFLWHYAFDLKDGTAIGDFMRFEVLKLNLSRSRWSVTHQPGRFRCKTPLPGHNMHPLPLVHVALAPLHSRRH